MMKLGLLGGTFDPIHVGHIRIASEIVARTLCDHILFIPTGCPPHREHATVTPAEHRREMVRLAIAEHPAFELSNIEIDGPSYSFQTVESIRRMHNDDAHLSFIIGLDNLFHLPHWRKPERILTTCDLIVVSRPGWEFANLLQPQYYEFFDLHVEPQYIEALDAGTCNELVIHPQPGTDRVRSMTLLRATDTDVSSREIRTKIAQQQDFRTLLPAPVESYILSAQLYRTEHIHPES